jgi:hypothetical protein
MPLSKTTSHFDTQKFTKEEKLNWDGFKWHDVHTRFLDSINGLNVVNWRKLIQMCRRGYENAIF